MLEHRAGPIDLLDLHRSISAVELSALALVYEGLTRTGPDVQLEPAAAESWAFDATGTVLTLTLRPDLRYSDGSPIAAQDFAYSLRRLADPRVAGPYQHVSFDIVGAAELASTPPTDTERLEQALASFGALASDERTLVIRLRQPAPYLPSVLSLSLSARSKCPCTEASPPRPCSTAANPAHWSPARAPGPVEGA